MIFGPIGKTRWPPRSLIGWDVSDFSSVFVPIPQPSNWHQQPVFCNMWHKYSFRITIFDTKFMTLSYHKSCIKHVKIAYILYYIPKSLFSVPFIGQTFHSNTTFCENSHLLLKLSKHVREKSGKLCISSILSSKRGIMNSHKNWHKLMTLELDL